MQQKFHTKVFLPFFYAIITNIEERLPDTGVFAAFCILDPSRQPSPLEDAVTQKYGESKIDLQLLYSGESGVLMKAASDMNGMKFGASCQCIFIHSL